MELRPSGASHRRQQFQTGRNKWPECEADGPAFHWCRSISVPHHPGFFCGGYSRLETVHRSTPELHRLSPAAGFEPATFGSDVTRACATPQTFLKSEHTLSISRANSNHPPNAARKLKSGRNWRSRSLGFEPKPCGSTSRSNRELHHPGTPIPGSQCCGSK
jgi:hypothetical protein